MFVLGRQLQWLSRQPSPNISREIPACKVKPGSTSRRSGCFSAVSRTVYTVASTYSRCIPRNILIMQRTVHWCIGGSGETSGDGRERLLHCRHGGVRYGEYAMLAVLTERCRCSVEP